MLTDPLPSHAIPRLPRACSKSRLSERRPRLNRFQFIQTGEPEYDEAQAPELEQVPIQPGGADD
jgi:hypothetical protein